MVKIDNLIKLESEEFYFIFRQTTNIKALSKTNETYQVSITNEQPIINNDCSFFFHSKSFIERYDSTTIQTVCLFKENKPLATIPFVCSDNTASSLPKSPFGAIKAVADIKKNTLQYFTEHLVSQLQKQGIHTINITSFPRIYNAHLFDISHETFLDIGFTINVMNTSQYLPVDGEFRTSIKASEKRYLNNATKKGYVFRELTLDNLSQAYELIKDSRENKGYPVTMSFEDLKTTIARFPHNYLIFGLYHHDVLIATSVCIRVNSQILYTFYIGDNIDFRKSSPVVPLIHNIYKYAGDNGFKILDLGLSTENGKVNKGLFHFKESLGALTTEKPTYILSL